MKAQLFRENKVFFRRANSYEVNYSLFYQPPPNPTYSNPPLPGTPTPPLPPYVEQTYAVSFLPVMLTT